MRPIELILVLVNVLIILSFVAAQQRQGMCRLIASLVAVNAALIAAHLLFEGYRWQMIPVYILGIIEAAGLAGMRWQRMPRWAMPVLMSAASVLLVVGAAAMILLPVPHLPEPSGPYAIGTFTTMWVDESRQGVYTNDSDEPRSLNVQVWYPADGSHGRALKWVPNGILFGRAMTGWVGLPEILLDQVGLIDTHTYRDLATSADEAAYPVVIYSHGWGGTRNINQDQIEALASEGYIVISADHTYGALVTQFPDGRTVYYDPDALPEGLPQPEADANGKRLISTFGADLRFMLDQLEVLNADETSPVGGHMDLSRIGLFGHSTGGGAVMLACSEDPRCKAALGMDTWVVPLGEDFVDEGLDQPVMLINSEVWGLERNRPLLETMYAALRGDRYWVTIGGSDHYDFVMVPLFSPLAVPLRLKGPIAGERMVQINHAYLIAFFDRYLKGKDVSLLDGPPVVYPEVTFKK